MPQSPTPEVQQTWSSLSLTLIRMPSPAEAGHQEKEEDEEREEDTEGHRQLRREPSITSPAQAACKLPVTEGTSSSRPRTEGKNNLGFALFVNWTDSLRVLRYLPKILTSSVLQAYMFKGQESQINKLLI